MEATLGSKGLATIPKAVRERLRLRPGAEELVQADVSGDSIDIEMMLAADTLAVENDQEVYEAVVALRSGARTFEDASILEALGIWRERSTSVTFDEKAAQRPQGFSLA